MMVCSCAASLIFLLEEEVALAHGRGLRDLILIMVEGKEGLERVVILSSLLGRGSKLGLLDGRKNIRSALVEVLEGLCDERLSCTREPRLSH